MAWSFQKYFHRIKGQKGNTFEQLLQFFTFDEGSELNVCDPSKFNVEILALKGRVNEGKLRP